MNNEEIINELKEINFKIIDNNRMLEQKLENISKDLINMKKRIGKKIESLEKRIESHEKRIENHEKRIAILENKISNQEDRIEVLEYKYGEINEALGKIQTRDFDDRFLKSLNPYLIAKDLNMIREDKQKRKNIISDRIENKFESLQKTKKIKIIINRIKNCCNCVNKGNKYVLSIAIEYCQEDKEAYKKRKSL